MNVAAGEAMRWRHWLSCFALVTLVHASLAVALVAVKPKQETHGSGPVVAVTLAEFVAAPPAAPTNPKSLASTTETQLPHSTEAAKSLPDQPPEPNPEVPLPEALDSRLEDTQTQSIADHSDPEQAEEQPAAETVAASASAREEAAQSVAPSQQAQQREGIASLRSSWQGRVNAHLERHKTYPHRARAQREEGEARLRFRVDTQGRIVGARLESGTGYFLLDREVQAALRRAQPLPKPPDAIAEEDLEMIWLVEFVLR